MTNYNSTAHPRQNKHKEELLLSLNSTTWETFHGDDRSDNHKREHVITTEPVAMSYLALLDSEIATNSDIDTEVKVVLIKFLSFYFDRLLQWQSKQRGRKIGIFGNLTLGYIMHTQDSKLHLELDLYRMFEEEGLFVFKIDVNGRSFDTFNGYIFIHSNGSIYQMSDDRINEIQEKNDV